MQSIDKTTPAAELKEDRRMKHHSDRSLQRSPAREFASHEIDRLITELESLRSEMLRYEQQLMPALLSVAESHQASSRNLIHYTVLRRHDLRTLQERLMHLGLSSLGRCEPHVLENLNAILRLLYVMKTGNLAGLHVENDAVTMTGSRRVLELATVNLLGPCTDPRRVHIMVTMPTSAATDYRLVRDLLARGMGCMRINCAHDNTTIWQGMIANLRRAEKELGLRCRILMDLGGPKLRTGPIQPGPAVIRWRPRRDSFGKTIAPARIWLAQNKSDTSPPLPADMMVHLVNAKCEEVEVGDKLTLKDVRGKRRTLDVVGVTANGLWCEARQSAFVVEGTEIRLYNDKKTLTARSVKEQQSVVGEVGPIEPSAQSIILYAGDTLIVSDELEYGSAAKYDALGRLLEPARIGCTLPEVLAAIRTGDRILFDDGKIGGVVRDTQRHYVVVEVTEANESGVKLQSDKGINLPDTDLGLEPLTTKDLLDLDFVVQQADIVGHSFVRSPDDVVRLQSELAKRGRQDLGILLKIENRQAFERLPSLLLTALRSAAVGVMIARGDLAVECGYERLAEVQEEILWMCEAAHTPVVWATQVLERLAKSGTPSRAEITDAAMGVRAECVMLNKGPHILRAVTVLDDILCRMQDHQTKKRSLMRRLRLCDDMPDLAGTDVVQPSRPERANAETRSI